MLRNAPAGTISFGYAVVSDTTTPSERGAFVGAVLLGPNVASSLGSVLGGALVQYAGWRCIFWTLAILSSVNLCILVIALPETACNIVGNGWIDLSTNATSSRQLQGSPSALTETEGTRSRPLLAVPSLMPLFQALCRK